MIEYVHLLCVHGPVPGKVLKYRADGEAQRALEMGWAEWPGDDDDEPEVEVAPSYGWGLYEDNESEE